jgi:predicted nucleic acid-binding protein
MERARRHRRERRVRESAAPRYAAEAKTERLTGVLLDSDIVIEILRGRREVADALAALDRGGVPTYCTAITWAEIYAGIRAGEETLTEAFFAARGEVVLDAVAGRRAGSYLARYAASHGVELGDALVAAAATTSDLHLWTLNRRHYPMPDIDFYEP